MNSAGAEGLTEVNFRVDLAHCVKARECVRSQILAVGQTAVAPRAVGTLAALAPQLGDRRHFLRPAADS